MDTSNNHTKSYLVTGANTGLGLDTVRKLSILPETKAVYMACRSEAKFEAAVKQVKSKGVQLLFVKFDAADDKATIANILFNSVREPLDGLVLNAGGIGHDKLGKAAGPNNVIPMHQINVVAHVQMLESLKNNNLLNPGCRIVYSGSEAARGIPTFLVGNPKMGSQAAWYKDELEGKHAYDPMKTYSVTKGIGALYFAAWARRNPGYFVLVVSPGATLGTEGLTTDAVPGHFKVMISIMKPLMSRSGLMHSLSDGSDRYVHAVLGEGDMKEFASGTFVASARGTTGKVSNQTKTRNGKKYNDREKQDAVYKVMSMYLKEHLSEQPLGINANEAFAELLA